MSASVAVISVRDLTRIIKDILEGSALLQGVWVRGEVSNFRRHTSGHLYFTLKDDTSGVKCVMFRGRATRLKFDPEDGMGVLLLGSVSVYERDGQYQFYVDDIVPDGVGSLFKAFQQLKDRLEAEGLFDVSRKRPLPRFPERVGVVTSLKGAAVRDIVNVARRRWPAVRLVLCDVTVQGDSAPKEILRGLNLVASTPGVDVIIVGRGGGSIEELWAFNDEALARAIRACPVPVVSAVGHETDFTIADFAADLRAPTPSAAAELVVPDIRELLQRIASDRDRISKAVRRHLDNSRYIVDMLKGRPVLRRGGDLVVQRRQAIDDATREMGLYIDRRIKLLTSHLRVMAGKLDAMSPLKILGRGYALIQKEDGNLVKSWNDVSIGSAVNVQLAAGQLVCEVTGRKES
jgi:exodeoxyribonuclease VII large subunit